MLVHFSWMSMLNTYIVYMCVCICPGSCRAAEAIGSKPEEWIQRSVQLVARFWRSRELPTTLNCLASQCSVLHLCLSCEQFNKVEFPPQSHSNLVSMLVVPAIFQRDPFMRHAYIYIYIWLVRMLYIIKAYNTIVLSILLFYMCILQFRCNIFMIAYLGGSALPH